MTARLLVALMFIVSAQAFAQETTATLHGTARDQDKAAIPAVKITATNELTGFKRTTLTDSSGDYRLPLLPVGTYELTAEAPGFRQFVRKGITLAVNQSAVVDAELVVGAVHERVEVMSEASTVQTDRAEVSEVISRREIEQLPLNGRNFLQLATLQAGIAPGLFVISEFTPGHPGQLTFNANGLRPQSNNFLLDGADNNDGFLGTAAAVPSPDALQEFRILTSSYSAEYGRGAGAVVNILTRGGTNEFHGAAYDFLRNKAFDARNFFSADVPGLVQNQFGGAFGGPMRRNETFFFGSYEGFRRTQGVTSNSVIPSGLEREGDFSLSGQKPRDPKTRQPYPDNVIPSTSISPIARNILGLLPLPNRGANELAVTQNGSSDTDQALLRVDHAFTPSNTFSARHFLEDGSTLKPFTTPPPINVPGFPFQDHFRFQNLVAADTHTFSPRLLNEARVVYSRTRTNFNDPAYKIDPASLGFSYPIAGEPNMPLIFLSGLTAIGTSFETNGLRRDNIFQFQDHVTYVRGRHSLKTGADIFRNRYSLREDNSNAGNFNFSGAFAGNPITDLLLGLPARFTQATPGDTAYFFSTYVQPYVQDDVRISRRLTLNLGLRYELNLPASEEQERLIGFRPGAKSTRVPQAPAGLLFLGDPGLERIMTVPKRNFAPRAGFAWDLFGDGRTSVRGGYGVYYDIVLETLYGNFVVSTPYTTTLTLTAPTNFADPFGGRSPIGSGASNLLFPELLALNIIDGNYSSPYAQHWNLSVERELFDGFVMEAGYLGTKGTHLPGTRVLNTATFVPGNSTPRNVDQRRPFAPAFGQILNYQSTFNSTYHSLQLTGNKRFGRGLSLLAAYTWSKAIDDNSYPTGRRAIRVGTIAQNQDDLRSERGLSNFDMRHRFVVSYIWELPWFRDGRGLKRNVLGGWQLNGITAFNSGRPYIIQDSSDPNLDGVASDRPNVMRNPNLPAAKQTLDRFFDTGAFVRLPQGTNGFGNAGRNIVIGPGFNNFDAALAKRVHVSERSAVEFRWEVFNVFNHPNFDNPGGGTPTNDISSPVFGRISSTVPSSERIMQFGLKLAF